MSRGNSIVVSPFTTPAQRVEGIIGAGLTPKPGTIMQLQVATALQGGRHIWELYNSDADGGNPKGPVIILTEDSYQGRTVSDAYAAGERAFGFIPRHGDEVNLLVKNETGTGDDHTKGEILIIDDGTGLMVPTASTPERESAILLESITDPASDTLAWCQWQD